MKLLSIIMSILLLSAVSCKKSSNDNSCAPSKANMSGTWDIISMYVTDLSTGQGGEVTAQFPCVKDDQFIFNSDGTYTYNNNTTPCQIPLYTSGTWSVNGNILNIDAEVWTVASFDCKTCVVSSNQNGYSRLYTVRLK